MAEEAPAASQRRAPIAWSRIVWAIILIISLPYILGFLYAILMRPAHALSCKDVSFNERDYLYYLSGKGCKAPPAPQCNSENLFTNALCSYQHKPRYWNGADQFGDAAAVGAQAAVNLQATNTIFQALVFLFLFTLPIVYGTIVKRLSVRIADAVFDKMKGSQKVEK